MANNFNNETYKCLFCYGITNSLMQNEIHLTLQQIISSCNTHLTNELFASIDWTSINSIGGSFCQKCYQIVEKLVSLADHLNRILRDIKELDSNLVNRVSRERIINQHPNDRFKCKENNFTENNYDIPYAEVGHNVNNTTEAITEIRNESSCSNHYDTNVLLGTGDNEDEPETTVTTHETSNTKHTSGKTKTMKKSAKKKTQSNSKEDSTESTAPKPKVVVLSSEVKRHLENKDTPGYECEKCHKRFSRLTILQRHDCSKPTIECEVCNISFSGTGVLKLHMRSHTGEKPFKCESCGKCFTIKQHLETHMRIHTGERPFKCEMCEKSYRDKRHYTTHMAKHRNETEERIYKCDLCSKSFSSFQSLKRHLKYHDGERPHKCRNCEKAFVTQNELKKHLMRVNDHTGENPFKCEMCKKAFAHKDALNIHIKSHGEKCLCEECGKYFATDKYLEIHLLTHTEKGPFICETCGKKYPSSVRLKQHIRYYHDERAIKCGTCNIVFKNKPHLLRHQNALECEGPPFKCIQCDTYCESKTARERHRILEHVSEKERPNFPCEECQETFHLKADLTVHVKKIHPGAPLYCVTCKQQFKDKRCFQSHKKNSAIQCKYCPQKLSSDCYYYVHRVHDHLEGVKKNNCFCIDCNLAFVDQNLFQAHIKSCHPMETFATRPNDDEPDEESSQSSYSRTGLTRKCKLKSAETNNLILNEESESNGSDNGFEDTYDVYGDSDDDEKIEIKEEEEFGMDDSEMKPEFILP